MGRGAWDIHKEDPFLNLSTGSVKISSFMQGEKEEVSLFILFFSS